MSNATNPTAITADDLDRLADMEGLQPLDLNTDTSPSCIEGMLSAGLATTDAAGKITIMRQIRSLLQDIADKEPWMNSILGTMSVGIEKGDEGATAENLDKLFQLAMRYLPAAEG